MWTTRLILLTSPLSLRVSIFFLFLSLVIETIFYEIYVFRTKIKNTEKKTKHLNFNLKMAVQIYYVQCALCKDACIMMSNNFLAN